MWPVRGLDLWAGAHFISFGQCGPARKTTLLPITLGFQEPAMSGQTGVEARISAAVTMLVTRLGTTNDSSTVLDGAAVLVADCRSIWGLSGSIE